MNPFTSRRDFVKAGSSLTAGALLAAPHVARAAKNDKIIKVGLVGIGGRGSGAAAQAMGADDNVALTAIGDLFEDRIKLRSRILKARGRNKFQVTPETTFSGFDAYKKVIDSGVDVVILTSPPAFRPQHLAYAIEKGVHCFFEKPVAVDAPASGKSLSWPRRQSRRISTSCRVFAGGIITPSRKYSKESSGEIGDVNADVQHLQRWRSLEKSERRRMGDLEAQMRNWNAHLWLSGTP